MKNLKEYSGIFEEAFCKVLDNSQHVSNMKCWLCLPLEGEAAQSGCTEAGLYTAADSSHRLSDFY